MTTYTAESRPISGPPNARRVIATGDNETTVRHELTMYLITSTAGMASARQKKYYAASNAIADGVDGVEVESRVYRIRKEG
jgi:hypothetical protein